MKMKDIAGKTPEELEQLSTALAKRGNFAACVLVDYVRDYYHKRVRVVKGRKVKHGTEGEVFWMGCYDNSRFGDPWGIYTTVRVGIRDDDGNVHWTSVENVEVVSLA